MARLHLITLSPDQSSVHVAHLARTMYLGFLAIDDIRLFAGSTHLFLINDDFGMKGMCLPSSAAQDSASRRNFIANMQ
eukprot:6183295-Pleurochrysis_carterae.AAC.1